MENVFALRAHCRQDVCAPSETWRVFCAIELPEALREQIGQHIIGLRSATEAKASWSSPDNIHLTLKFLGDVEVERVATVSSAVAAAVSSIEPFKIRVEGVGAFPPRGAPRVLWIGVNDLEGRLAQLHARIEDRFAKAGFAKESRQFHPHLTLARLRKPLGASALAAAHKERPFKPGDLSVSELIVIRSELSSKGSKYTTISRHPLTRT